MAGWFNHSGGGKWACCRRRLSLAVLLILMASAIATAATSTTSLSVTASVSAGCTMQASTDVAFGPYDPVTDGDNTAGDGTINMKCVKGTNYGTYITGTRTMSNGIDSLSFSLWVDPGRTSSSYPGGSPGLTDMSPGIALITKHVYGRVSKNQDAGQGTFSATLTAVVEY